MCNWSIETSFIHCMLENWMSTLHLPHHLIWSLYKTCFWKSTSNYVSNSSMAINTYHLVSLVATFLTPSWYMYLVQPVAYTTWQCWEFWEYIPRSWLHNTNVVMHSKCYNNTLGSQTCKISSTTLVHIVRSYFLLKAHASLAYIEDPMPLVFISAKEPPSEALVIRVCHGGKCKSSESEAFSYKLMNK